MADLNYIYTHMYGVEPFDPNAVGAKITGQNLIVTAWTVTDFNPFGPLYNYTLGELLQPASQNDNLLPQRRAASGQTLHSRCSAQVFIAGDLDQPLPAITDSLLFVLSPPPELRQQWSKALVYNGGDPTDLANYTLLKSLMCGYLWKVLAESMSQSQAFAFTTANLAFWGTPVDLGDFAGGPDVFQPLLKTSGADGQPPEAFAVTPQGTSEMIAAVNAGEFYIPLIVFGEFSENNPVRITVTYPHSTARG